MNSNTDHTQGTKKRALVATIAIFGSRILGLVREQVFAFFFGAGAVLDAFYVAFRIPNLLRDLAAEGALSQSFITIFSQQLAADKHEEAKKLANKMTGFIVLVMGFVTVLGFIFAPQITSLIATGFEGQKYDLTVRLMRILFPYIFFISLSALLMGVLNSNKKFFIPFSASTFGNMIAIFAGLIFAWLMSPDYIGQTVQKLFSGKSFETQDYLAVSNAIAGMAFGSTLAGFGQYVFQMPLAWKIGFLPKVDFKLRDSELLKVLKLTGPAVIAGAAVQVNVLVNTEFASLLTDGSVAWLNFAFRFMQFPLGLFGVSIAAASAPVLAQMIAQNRHQNFKESIQSSIQMCLFLTVPSMVGLLVLGKEIIALIYEHGHFTAADTLQTAYALWAYALGISSYALIKIYQPAYLAFHDAKTPMRISIFSILINAGINSFFILVLHWSHWSLACGTAIVAITNLILLTLFFRKNVSGIWSKDLLMTGIKILLASIVMGASLIPALRFLKNHVSEHALWGKLILVFVPMLLAAVVYLGAALLFKIKDAQFLARKLSGKFI